MSTANGAAPREVELSGSIAGSPSGAPPSSHASKVSFSSGVRSMLSRNVLQSSDGCQGGIVPLTMDARTTPAKAVTSSYVVMGKGPMSPAWWHVAQRASMMAFASPK